MLSKLHHEVKGEPSVGYYGYKITRNSRYVTATYPDGVTVGIMPVARIPSGPERSGVLFHHNAKHGEKSWREVNPKAFTVHFNTHIEASAFSPPQYRTRRLRADGFLQDRADTQPMPSPKSKRVGTGWTFNRATAAYLSMATRWKRTP
ncbi:hypothetical protein [Rhizobium laguerreae]|uniref:hypothetical protein n=1 Tax=Rhizobium laguerreae TaxID=1076926 RepID=UPI001C907C1A|nr:hypothetical protein [Rhizobium laguerreae]MBY3386310.1 hypothetical protein [Rhizobium laguerreae]MBY3400393.1 hypothetical protein [Rhizobium laguerreae]MBY3407330.1 hypothetical protein [Rhizobium laguerreae]